MKYVRSIEQFGILKGKHMQYKYFDTIEARDQFNQNSEFRECDGENLYLYDENEHEYVEILKTENEKNNEIKKEYIEYINILKNKLKNLENEKNELKNKNKNSEIDIEDYKKMREQNNKLFDILENYEDIKKELEIEKAKNNNLLRIMRERANAKRGLKPKKEHNGYLAIFNREVIFTFRYKEFNKIKTMNYDVWKLKLETPYSSTIELEYIINDIQTDLLQASMELEFDSLSRFNFKEIIEKENTKEINRFKSMINDINKIYIFDIKYEANFKKGLWEIELLANREIKIGDVLK